VHAFDPAALEHLDEPVRRYLTHAIAPGAALHDRVRLTMEGRIDVGRRLAFSATQEFDGHAFVWRARAGLGPFRPLHVVDTYRPGAGSTSGKLFGRIPFLRADDEDTARAAAGRAAAECVWSPRTLLPDREVTWAAESDELIVARFAVPPEDAEVRLTIAPDGALRTVRIMRWGNVGQRGFGPIPFGGDVHAERRFGDLTLPSRLTVGWWYGTPRFKPFFEATILAAETTA
jgi:hypothetical protein